MNDSKIAQILNKLLVDQNLRVSELARRINLPQPTIQRIAAGTCMSPRSSNLKTIADYFSITVDQLKGIEPIHKFDKISKLPLLSWEEVIQFQEKGIHTSMDKVIADVDVSDKGYALKVIDGAMEPMFPRDTILIIDPKIQPKDKNYVIALVHKKNFPIFRQLIVNGSDKFLKPLSPDTDIYKMTPLHSSDKILGIVVQARRNYLD